MVAKELEALLHEAGNKEKAELLQRYFKTRVGEYGAGDTFLGITVPVQRKIAHRFISLSLTELKKVLVQPIHEYRFTTLEILVAKYEKADEEEREKIYTFYLKNTKYINNWDLVDTSCEYIVGDFLRNKDRKTLYMLAHSKNIWERRIAIVSTFAYIKQNDFKDAIALSEILLTDIQDLIHKAVGWMLREVGKRSKKDLELFLQKHAQEMPRTSLRYSLEHFGEEARKHYMTRKKQHGKVV